MSNFIEMIVPIVQKYAKIYGYKYSSPVIAQAILESNSGKSNLSAKYHNYFGLKCGSSWKGKSVNMRTQEEYKRGQLTSIRDNFRVYNSVDEGIKGYFDFINTSRYANLKNATSAKNYVELIKKDGYATDNSYIVKVCNIIDKYNLTQYDGEVYVNKDKTVVINAVKEVQTALNNYGNYSLVIDGIIGPKTKEAVRRFNISKGNKEFCKNTIKNLQTKLNEYGGYGLAVDGIIGPKTLAAYNNFRRS